MEELSRPGVEVSQEFTTSVPTPVSPTLPACIIGPAKQMVDVFSTAASGSRVLNNQSLVILGAIALAKPAVGSPAVYTGLNGLDFVFEISGSPDVTVTFSDPLAVGITPTSAVAQINDAMLEAGALEALAVKYGTTQWFLKTLATGEFATLKVKAGTHASVLTAFGFALNKVYQGISVYNQYQPTVFPANFPDPVGNLTELSIENDTIRAFLSTGVAGQVTELLRTESFLRRGAGGTAAVLTGSVDASVVAGGTLNGLTLEIRIDTLAGEGVVQTVTFTTPANIAAQITQINAQTTGFTASGATNLIFTSDETGYEAEINVTGGTAAATLGFTGGTSFARGAAAVRTIDDGNGDNFTSIVRLLGSTLTTAGATATRTGIVALTGLTLPGDLANKVLTLSDGRTPQSFTFTTEANAAACVTALNGFFGAAAQGRLSFALDGSNFLVITHTQLGDEAIVDIVGGDAVTVLGLTVGKTRGVPFPPKVGDQLYVDGSLYGTISQVAPGAVVTDVKVNKQVAINENVGHNWYVIAKGLTGVQTSTRPSANLIVGTDGSAIMKHEFFRDTMGVPVASASNIFLQYRALRLDVTQRSATPGILAFSQTSQIEASLPPVSSENPLGLGVYFAVINSPGRTTKAIGVDAISADAPYGTSDGYSRAFGALESQYVYGLVPLTHDTSVGQIGLAHALAMSEPSSKSERIILFNPAQPTSKMDTIVTSGTNGNGVSGSPTVFDTGVPSLPQLLLSAGVTPTGTIPASAGVFLDIASDSKRYNVQSISGGVVTLRTAFAPGENDDNYYSTTNLSVSPLMYPLIDETYAIRVRGASLLDSDGVLDKEALTVTYKAMAEGYLSRRFRHIIADKVYATVGGIEQAFEGFYACCAIAGLVAGLPPQQSLTNYPIAGFTKVTGTNGFLSEKQLDRMAGSGNWILVQDEEGAPVITRQALTTDMTSLAVRTDTTTNILDFCAYFIRRGLKNFAGRFNITSNYLDMLSTVMKGMLTFLEDNSVIISGDLDKFVQDVNERDNTVAECDLVLPIPNNKIRVTLRV